MSKPNKDGWIRHRGGKCPVDAGTLVDARYRDGEIRNRIGALVDSGCDPENWVHEKNKNCSEASCDIMAFRIHKPAEQPAHVAAAAVQIGINAADAGRLTTIADVKARFTTDGPLQWRDRITEIDRTVEALEEERVSLVQRLEGEGFRLIERAVQPVEDMSDPANWRNGDLITFVEEVSGSCFTTGKQYIFKELSGYGSAGVLADDEGDENGWDVEFFKFHGRPSK